MIVFTTLTNGVIIAPISLHRYKIKVINKISVVQKNNLFLRNIGHLLFFLFYHNSKKIDNLHHKNKNIFSLYDRIKLL